jgi:hypothetical protein
MFFMKTDDPAPMNVTLGFLDTSASFNSGALEHQDQAPHLVLRRLDRAPLRRS